MQITIESQKRQEGTKPRALRRSGLVPAVLYGHNGTESVSLTVEEKTVERLLKTAAVNNTIVQLNVTDMPWNGPTLLREVQKHPWKGFPYHLSFFAVAAHGALEVEVPLHFVGDAEGVKKEGGILDPLVNQLTVKCLPDRIPEFIEVNVAALKVGDSLHVGELSLPEGVQALSDAGRAVVAILPPQVSAAAE